MKIINHNGVIEDVSFDDHSGKEALRHTASHILAQAVKRLYPETKLAIGPAIKDGFYYDFDRDHPFTEDELGLLEAEMKKIIKENLKLERFTLDREKARALIEELGETYKTQLLDDIPDGEEVSFFRQGEFVDLCAGPHLTYTSGVKAFALLSIAGAYWRGSEKNKMLTRIYGTAFESKQSLADYLAMLEEAKRRDHRKLGKELGLFAIMEEGPGFPFFLPNGMIVKNELIGYWREIHRRDGYREIQTPILLTKKLWETSGHWEHYKSNIYTTSIDDTTFAVKPMNCPGGMLVYKSEPHSYKDLPLKLCELGLVHRHEKSGELHGLMRVRCFTQDDAHIFMVENQIQDQIKGVLNLVDEVYSLFGFKYHIELSTMPEDHMGDEKDWETATRDLVSALDGAGLPYIVNEGDGAFYGPKIDFHLEDSLGRTWQCGTIQLDFQMPQRFELEYTGADGQKHRPIMIHRVVYGSIERFIGILIEHFAGKFPVWLSPEQVRVLPITDKNNSYAEKVLRSLKDAGVRCDIDKRQEKTGYKIREAAIMKVPYILVIGEKEEESNTVTVRRRDSAELAVMDRGEFAEKIKREITQRQ